MSPAIVLQIKGRSGFSRDSSVLKPASIAAKATPTLRVVISDRVTAGIARQRGELQPGLPQSRFQPLEVVEVVRVEIPVISIVVAGRERRFVECNGLGKVDGQSAFAVLVVHRKFPSGVEMMVGNGEL